MASEIDRILRQHSAAVREERVQKANDERIAQGLPPLHCGRPVKTNRLGDYVCAKCGDIF